MKGKLIKWVDDKAFGFIQPNSGGAQVFIHKSAFINHQRTPKISDVITFTLVKDKQERYCASEATYSGEKLTAKKNKPKDSGALSVLFACSFLIGITIASYVGYLPMKLVNGILAISVITFLMYATDKIKAHRNAWRISENTLHFWALFGGWPGAAVAQQLFRHKSKKASFRDAFWLTVFVNCGALILIIVKGGPILALFE